MYDRLGSIGGTRTLLSPIYNHNHNSMVSSHVYTAKVKSPFQMLMCHATSCAAPDYNHHNQKSNQGLYPPSLLPLQRSNGNRPYRLDPNTMTVSSSTSSLSSSSQTSSSSKSSSVKSSSRRVSFASIEIKEHPRILGDNPSPKKGPALSIGWFIPCHGRILKYSIDEYEAMRAPHRRKRGAHALSSSSRQKLLIREAGVTPSEIFIARREASYIRSSRRKQQINTNGMLQQYDETAAMVMENCVRTVQQLMNGNMSECELRSLMQQAERAKQQQRQQHLVNQ